MDPFYFPHGRHVTFTVKIKFSGPRTTKESENIFLFGYFFY